MNYVVKAGDTLSKIATRNGITMARLLELNPTITNANKIKVGDKINLPDTSTENTKPLPKDFVPPVPVTTTTRTAAAPARAFGKV